MGLNEMILECGYGLPEDKKSCTEFYSSLDGSLSELKLIYQERLPYTYQEKLDGICVQFEDAFILLCRYAMSTDCMESMTAEERQIWRSFVDYEEAYATAAGREQCEGKAQAATDYITIELWDGFVRTGTFPLTYEDEEWGFYKYLGEDGEWHWKIMPRVPMVPQYCFGEQAYPPTQDISKAYVYDALDDIFYNIHECKPYNDCSCADYELQINDCSSALNPIGPEDIYQTGCGSGYQGCSIKIEPSKRRL